MSHFWQKVLTNHKTYTIIKNVKRRKEFVWEHFGMMDNISYANKNVQKLNVYEQNGFTMGDNLIATFEGRNTSLNMRELSQSILSLI